MAKRFFEADHAAVYAKFRPQAPVTLVEEILSFLKQKYDGPMAAAADVGCGSGQSTWALASYFTSVTGLDVSTAQITEANKLNTKKNVSFEVSGAEKLPFQEHSLQVVTTGQACHWFDLPKFYAEVDRVLVPGGVLALYGYLFPHPMYGEVSDQLRDIVNDVYTEELEAYWGIGLRDVDNAYADPKYIIPFQDFTRVMSTLNVTTAPEDTELTLRFKYFLLMGRKPLQS